jgi:hypothetical protein
MPNISGKDITLWKAAARFKNLVYIAATMDDLVEQEVPHSTFVSMYNGQWHNAGDARWSTAAICVVRSPSERMVAVSEDGDVTTYVGGNLTSELIKPTPRTLTALTTINGRAYACGMHREVFVRTGEGQWQAISAPKPRPRERAGFEAIDGFSEDDIYSVGWRGEIWQRSNGQWIQHDSPVNVILTGVCCAGDGYVYACGQNGTLIKGRNDQWSVIDHEIPPEDFWDIHAFGDSVFVASFTGLCEIKNDVIELVDFGENEPATCHRLTSADGVLWSVGAEDVFSFDGITWQRVA